MDGDRGGEEEEAVLLLPPPSSSSFSGPRRQQPPLSPVRAKRMDGVYLQREEEGRGGGYGKEGQRGEARCTLDWIDRLTD